MPVRALLLTEDCARAAARALDADLASFDPRFVDGHRGKPDAKVRIVSFEGEDAARLRRFSAARGETPSELIVHLVRAADHWLG